MIMKRRDQEIKSFLLLVLSLLGVAQVVQGQQVLPPQGSQGGEISSSVLGPPGQETCACPAGVPAGQEGTFGQYASSPAPAAAAAGAAYPPPQPNPALAGGTCSLSKLKVRQDHDAESGGSKLLSLSDVTRIYGAGPLSEAQRKEVKLAAVKDIPFHCLDDRVTTAAVSTPGGDLGEFIGAMSAYVDERDANAPAGQVHPGLSQNMVDVFLRRYITSVVPAGRKMVHCTDDRALAHLEAEMQVENLDLNSPPDRVKDAGLLNKLTVVENHGDSHIRLLLKQPEAYGLTQNSQLVPMVLKAYYNLLWEQNSNPQSPLHAEPKLELVVLQGESNPSAFVEVSASEVCQQDGLAPLLTPRAEGRSLLVSHLDAASLRREELAAFFSKVANATPRKIDRERFHRRLDRHGWMALETTGRRIASGLPFYSLVYV